jgi:metal-responsive CopG/Arc/MetJ family transcriptional regulator
MTTKRPVGRPRVGEPVHIRLPAELIEWVDARAAERGQTRSDVFREMVEQARKRDRKRGAR